MTKLYADREGLSELPLTDEQIGIFMNRALAKAGAEELITPREIIRDYLTLLNILKDNPGASFEKLIRDTEFSTAVGDSQEPFNEKEERPVKAQGKKIGLFDIEI